MICPNPFYRRRESGDDRLQKSCGSSCPILEGMSSLWEYSKPKQPRDSEKKRTRMPERLLFERDVRIAERLGELSTKIRKGKYAFCCMKSGHGKWKIGSELLDSQDFDTDGVS